MYPWNVLTTATESLDSELGCELETREDTALGAEDMPDAQDTCICAQLFCYLLDLFACLYSEGVLTAGLLVVVEDLLVAVAVDTGC